jgi:hypothetical protein
MILLSSLVAAQFVATLLFAVPVLQPQTFCRATAGERGATVTRDSVGIRITENWQGSGGNRADITLSSRPIVAIGVDAVDSNYLFHNVVVAARTSSGDIIVAATMPPSLRLYSPSGAFVRRIGRDGQGPGEYQDVSSVFRAKDTLVIHDITSARLTFLSATGAVLSTMPIVAREATRTSGSRRIAIETEFRIAGRFADGSLLSFERSDTCYGRSPWCRPQVNGTVTDTMFLYRLVPGGARSGELARILDQTRFYYRYQNRDLASTAILPMSARASVATGIDRFFVSRGEHPEIQEYTAQGRLVGLIRECSPPVRRTAAETRRVRDSLLALSRTQDAIDRSTELHSNTPFPVYLPAYTRVLVDATGRVWARKFSFKDQPSNWYVFSAGRLESLMSLPSAIEPLEIGSDYLIAKHIDQYDVQTIQVYSLIRRGG